MVQIHADLTQEAVVNSSSLEWIESPAKGVYRKMLERDGDEVARATSIVKYDPNTSFPEHTHYGGEEFIVLEGAFYDHEGIYPQGSYVRHPINSKHQPWTKEGCILLVKLCQMSDEKEPGCVININDSNLYEKAACDEGTRTVLKLFTNSSTGEIVTADHFHPGSKHTFSQPEHGEEFYVLEGEIQEQIGQSNFVNYTAGTWVRHPSSTSGQAVTRKSEKGAKIWRKSGHLSMKYIIHDIWHQYGKK